MKRRGFLMLSGAALAGCGGGAPQIVRSTRLKLDIVWPARTRSLSAPGGALSAVVILESLGGGNSNFPAIDRETPSAGYTQSWTAPTDSPTGIVRLVVRFFAQRGGGGALVGTAAKTVVIAPDGTGAGTIAVEGKVATIEVSGPASIKVGDNATYTIAAKDSAGAAIALAPGAASFAKEGTGDAINVNPDGGVTGLFLGSGALSATLGDKKSAVFNLAVTTPTGARATIAAGQSVDVGKSKKLVASAVDAEGNPLRIDPSQISYEVEGEASAEILRIDSDGTMTGLKPGTATVRFTAAELTTTGTVAITTDVILEIPALQTLAVGDAKRLTATATDRSGNPLSGQSIAFAQITGSDVLSLAANGDARGLGAGISTITANLLGGVSPVQTVLIGDVFVSATGLRRFDAVVGEGAVAVAGGSVTVHYTGWLLNGSKFDSSRDRGQPATFDLDGLIAGWQEGIPGMKAGGKRFLVVPPELGYGSSPRTGIPANSTLVFEIELVSVG